MVVPLISKPYAAAVAALDGAVKVYHGSALDDSGRWNKKNRCRSRPVDAKMPRNRPPVGETPNVPALALVSHSRWLSRSLSLAFASPRFDEGGRVKRVSSSLLLAQQHERTDQSRRRRRSPRRQDDSPSGSYTTAAAATKTATMRANTRDSPCALNCLPPVRVCVCVFECGANRLLVAVVVMVSSIADCLLCCLTCSLFHSVARIVLERPLSLACSRNRCRVPLPLGETLASLLEGATHAQTGAKIQNVKARRQGGGEEILRRRRVTGGRPAPSSRRRPRLGARADGLGGRRLTARAPRAREGEKRTGTKAIGSCQGYLSLSLPGGHLLLLLLFINRLKNIHTILAFWRIFSPCQTAGNRRPKLLNC